MPTHWRLINIPDSKDPGIDIDWTSIRHESVGLIPNRCWSWGLCCLGWSFEINDILKYILIFADMYDLIEMLLKYVHRAPSLIGWSFEINEILKYILISVDLYDLIEILSKYVHRAPSLIGWAHTHNDPWLILYNVVYVSHSTPGIWPHIYLVVMAEVRMRNMRRHGIRHSVPDNSVIL